MLKAKTCQRCRELKPVEDFSRNRSRPDGLAHYCRPCKAEAAAKRYAARPEVVRQAARDYYQANRARKLDSAREYRETNRDALRKDNRARKAAALAADPERIRAQQRAWRAANPDRVRQYARKRYIDNPEKYRAAVAAWCQANRDASNEIRRRYKARKRSAVCVPFTTAQLAAKVAYWGDRCWVCAGSWDSIDHVKPLAKRGPHMLANLRPICTPCNTRKRDRWPFPVA